MRAESDLLEIRDKPEKKLTLRAGETRELAFRWSAPRAGKASLRFRVESSVLQETVEASLKVQPSWVREAVTIVGMTEDSVREGLAVPERFLGLPEEGLELTLDSTIASGLVEAIRFLELYPYDCLEQRTSKLFAYVLYDWLADNRSAVERELSALPGYQTGDGGFTYWQDPSHRRSSYYVSARTAHLLALAGERGIPAPAGLDWEALLGYLESGYAQAEPALKPYALYVLAVCGREVRAEALRAARQTESMGLAGRALLALTLERVGERAPAERLLADLRNYLRVGTRSVTLAGPVDSWYYFGGDTQAKAQLLMLYRRLAPESQITQALADDLLAAQRRGAWLDTSTTGWVLQAFAEYLAGSGERDADFQARVRLGSAVLAEQAFRGLSREPVTRRIDAGGPAGDRPRRGGAGGAVLPLEIGKQGRGRLYYTVSLSYALEAASQEARDEGIGRGRDPGGPGRQGGGRPAPRRGLPGEGGGLLQPRPRFPGPAGAHPRGGGGDRRLPGHLAARSARRAEEGPEAGWSTRSIPPCRSSGCTTRRCASSSTASRAAARRCPSWCGPRRRALSTPRRRRPS